jgi:hypothetical protein
MFLFMTHGWYYPNICKHAYTLLLFSNLLQKLVELFLKGVQTSIKREV